MGTVREQKICSPCCALLAPHDRLSSSLCGSTAASNRAQLSTPKILSGPTSTKFALQGSKLTPRIRHSRSTTRPTRTTAAASATLGTDSGTEGLGGRRKIPSSGEPEIAGAQGWGSNKLNLS